MKTGWIVSLQFGICLHKKDLYILQLIQIFFGGGYRKYKLSWGKKSSI